jgi:glycosyltransferase involved in cell wall biosynthesis
VSLEICFFGMYKIEPGYPVNRFLLKGLREAGCEVQECREALWEGFLHDVGRLRWRELARMGWRALAGYGSLVRKYGRQRSHQCVIVGYPGFFEILLCRLLNLFSGRLMVLVSFISLYDTIVVDRGLVSPGSWRAVLLKAIDKIAFRAADLVLADTQEQIRYYVHLFGLPEGKFQRSFVGHEFHEYEPHVESVDLSSRSLRVLFYGTYVPLHGVDVIIDAATQLVHERDICFTLIGRGQLFESVEVRARELRNVELIDRWLGPEELVGQIRSADLCLGIFGRTAKAARVIPFKVFGAIALRKPVVTRDSPAIREFLKDEESALLCSPDGPNLANAIARLHGDRALLNRVATSAYQRYQDCGTPVAIGRRLVPILEHRLAS